MINVKTFNQTLRSAILLPLAGLALLVVILFAQLGNLIGAARWTDHTYQVIAQDRKVRSLRLQMQSAERGYLLTRDPAFEKQYGLNKTDFERELPVLQTLVRDNPTQSSRIRGIKARYADWLRLSEQEDGLYRQHRDYRPFVAQEQAAATILDSRFDAFRMEEERLLRERTEATQQAAQSTRIAVLTLAGLLGIVLGTLIYRQINALARSYNGALAGLQAQADTLRRSRDEIGHKAEEIQALNTTLEQRVQDRTAQLEASNKELEAFSYSVSHDLRAPLRSIDGFSQALTEDYGDVIDADGRKYLERIRSNSRHMAGLIDDMLSLSRLTRADMSRARVDLSAVARDVAAELRLRDPERQVTIDIADHLPAEGDERLLRIALENLMGNAWKFTSKTPDARIQVGAIQANAQSTNAQSSANENGKTVYFVRDNGAGFDMAYADKLFGAFQRLHSVGEFEGTGIGLATVQRIVHRHGGRIRAEGVVGQGATFYFTLA